MNNFRIHAFSLLLLLTAAATWQGCKREHDAPPIEDLDNLTANKTIAALKTIHTLGGTPTEVTEDWIIEGIVVADDKSGNFYKSIVIQDSTGGLEVRLDATGLYNDYPVGRKIWIKCQGLFVGDYSGKPQIVGNVAGDAIAQVLIPNHIFRGPLNQTVTPAVRTITQLTDADVNTLIKLENVEFTAADMSKTYADAVNKMSVNLNITDCNSNLVLLRTSGYADFAGINVPDSSGSIVAVYSVFGTDKQLFIRDQNDVDMTGSRCTGGGGTTGDLMNIADVRAVFTGTTTTAPANKKIRGFVISDNANGNWVSKNLVLQDATAGIALRFAANHAFSTGDEIEVAVSGVELSEYNGLLQLNNVPTSNASLISSGNTVSPIVMTVANLNANFETYESMLVQIENATISGGTTYSGNRTVTDASGSITLYTSSFATFATNTIPSGNVNVTAVVSQFTSSQLLLRDANDVTGGTVIVYDLNETFSSTTITTPTPTPVDVAGWYNIAQVGAEKWEGREFSANQYARASAFQANPTTVSTWLISPAQTLNQDKFLSFDTECSFWVHDGLTVWISTDFNGSNIATATWTQLTADIATGADGNYVWVPSGNIDLSAYTGSTVYIGFKYIGDATTNTSTYDVDNVRIWNQ